MNTQVRTEQRKPQGEQRLRRAARSTDRFAIDPARIPDKTTYEWKRQTFVGKEDKDYQVRLSQDHWRPVPASRHPELSAEGGDRPIVRDGLILMERPSYLTEEARAEDRRNAEEQEAQQMRRLQGDIGVGRDFRQTPSTINRSYERSAIPEDEPPKE